ASPAAGTEPKTWPSMAKAFSRTARKRNPSCWGITTPSGSPSTSIEMGRLALGLTALGCCMAKGSIVRRSDGRVLSWRDESGVTATGSHSFRGPTPCPGAYAFGLKSGSSIKAGDNAHLGLPSRLARRDGRLQDTYEPGGP